MTTFPNFQYHGPVPEHGKVAKQIRELVVTFNAEGLEALKTIPQKNVLWADVGSRVTVAAFDAKIPIQLTPLVGFQPFTGSRRYHQVTVTAVPVSVAPYDLNLEWPIVFDTAGNAELKNFYGASGIANGVVSSARAHKADLLAALIGAGASTIDGSTSASPTAYTIAQPGLPNGLPLFTDGTVSAQHYANPLDPNSKRFSNLYCAVGKFQDYFSTCLTHMTQVPHATKANMTMGLEVTDIIGGTNMLMPFITTAVQMLSLQTTTSPGNLAAATTNILNAETVSNAQKLNALNQLIGYQGWQFHISPQLDADPYLVANPTKQMWITVSRTIPELCWAEFAAPSKEFAPRITVLGAGTEEATKSKMVRMIGDLEAGVAPGLPHCVKRYHET